jgi:hypothetical protein
VDDFDALRREFDRVSHFPGFDSSQRIWWIYLREAVEKVLERHDLPELQAAYNRVKDFPESKRDEAAQWVELRDAVERVMGREERGFSADRAHRSGSAQSAEDQIRRQS